MTLGEAHTLTVDGHRDVLVLVRVDSDYYLSSGAAFTTHNFCHSYLLKDGTERRRAGQVSGQDCDGA